MKLLPFLLVVIALINAFSASVLAADRGVSGKCQLVVNGQTYVNGPCKVTMYQHGSFGITGGGFVGVGVHRREKYKAIVAINPATGIATGVWNGPKGESHLYNDLGNLIRQGACWINNHAKVCVTR